MTNTDQKNAEPIPLGAFSGSYGVKGWVRIRPFNSADSLFSSRKWYAIRPDGSFSPIEVEDVKFYGKGLIAKIKGYDTPEASATLKGAVGLMREDFPVPEEDEFYWTDLIGCNVVNEKGEEIGQVKGLIETGANDVLEILMPDGNPVLIPFVPTFIIHTDIAKKLITVDWSKDWT